jgi:hypothetical protein
MCDTLTVVDLNEKCISACKTRFAGVAHIRYHVNDGRSLSMVPDESVDFAVSFDSLVPRSRPTMLRSGNAQLELQAPERLLLGLHPSRIEVGPGPSDIP